METASEIADRLSLASCRKFYDVYRAIDWPERLDGAAWAMSPELVSLHGTPAWDELDEARRRRLALHEMANVFSLILHGERLLVQGLAHRLYARSNNRPITGYLHHFLDEENKHMVMFGEYCHRSIGKVYPDRKLALAPRPLAPGEEEVVFFCMAMVVEELGDFYNVAIQQDERVDALTRRINHVHHIDEARHLAFGRRHLAELFERHAPGWDADALAAFRRWLGDYLRACWGEYYNPTAYRDAGIADAYEVRQAAIAHPASVAHRVRASEKLIGHLLRTGVLAERPVL